MFKKCLLLIGLMTVTNMRSMNDENNATEKVTKSKKIFNPVDPCRILCHQIASRQYNWVGPHHEVAYFRCLEQVRLVEDGTECEVTEDLLAHWVQEGWLKD